MTTKITNTTAKVLKVVGSCIVTAALVEVGYHGGQMLGNDIECAVNTVDSKINPIVMKKPGLFRKARPYNTRTKKFVGDNKKNSKKSK